MICRYLPAVAAVLGGCAVLVWLAASAPRPVAVRAPEAVPSPPRAVADTVGRNEGTLVMGDGVPSALAGSWQQFRGPDRTNVVRDVPPLARSFPSEGPNVLWRIEAGEGHAGAAVHNGRVYMMDYDRDRQEDVVRCLSLDDGREIWRHTYSVVVRRNHGMSRTVPAVTDDYVVTLGPKCHVVCLEARDGTLLWKKDLVEENGTRVPPWYAGQCPLIDGDRVILAPGADPLMMAVDLATGEPVWETENPGEWGMTHSSVAIVQDAGPRQ